MPTEAAHLDEVQRNEGVADMLLQSAGPYPEWAITALFYAALHLAEAYFFRIGVGHSAPPQRRVHFQRERLMLRLGALRNVVDSYKILKTYSENARYDCRQFNSEEAVRIKQNFYAPVSQLIRSLLT